MICRWRWVAGLALLAGLSACQSPDRRGATAPVAPAVTVQPVGAQPADLNWSAAGDCRGMLATLHHGLEAGDIVDLDDTPFLLIGQGLTTGLRGRSTPGRRSMALSHDPDARCVLRIGQAIDHRSDQRVLGREQVRSRYQSGTRREKNPAYEVAKVRLRRAEKAAKPGKSSILKVGDPLLDLVGTVVGGALTGLGQWGAGDQVEEALDALMATPPSIEHPKYRNYHFERARIRASRAATIPVILTDRRLGRSWEASLQRRELKELSIVTGLDRQDADYTRHSAGSLTEDGLRQWLSEAPSLPITDVAAALLDRSATIPTDRLALAAPKALTGDNEPLSEDAALDAALLPVARQLGVEQGMVDRSPSGQDGRPSLIEIIGDKVRAKGVFVAPHFILTSSDVVGERGLVDIEDRPGHVALGLVAAVDRALGLAMVQAPLEGHPVTIADLPQASHSRRADSSTPGNAVGTPLLVGGKLVGFEAAAGPPIESAAIRIFLDRQRHLLPVER